MSTEVRFTASQQFPKTLMISSSSAFPMYRQVGRILPQIIQAIMLFLKKHSRSTLMYVLSWLQATTQTADRLTFSGQELLKVTRALWSTFLSWCLWAITMIWGSKTTLLLRESTIPKRLSFSQTSSAELMHITVLRNGKQRTIRSISVTLTLPQSA